MGTQCRPPAPSEPALDIREGHRVCVKLAPDLSTLIFNLRDSGNCEMLASHLRRVPRNVEPPEAAPKFPFGRALIR